MSFSRKKQEKMLEGQLKKSFESFGGDNTFKPFCETIKFHVL